MSQRAPADFCRKLRSLADRSLYFFEKVILGFEDLTPDLHGEICEFLQAPGQFKLLELPMGHLKSHTCTIGYSLWRIVQDPSIRILIRNAVLEKAEGFVSAMKWHFTDNALFRAIYADLIPADVSKTTWHSGAFTLPCRKKFYPEHTVTATGSKGTATGGHYNLIIEDDLVNEDHTPGPEQMAHPIEVHKAHVGRMNDRKHDQVIVVGNRWAFNDLNSWIRANEPHYQILSKGATTDGTVDGPAIWPERFGDGVLPQLLTTLGPRLYSAFYANNPVAEDSRSFDPTMLRKYGKLPELPLRVLTAVDPSISERKTADPRAIVTIGMDPDYSIYVLDARRGRWGVDEFIDHLFDVQAIWKPRVIGFEADGYQKLFFWPIREAMRRHGVTLNIQAMSAIARGRKIAHIETLHEYLANGSLWIGPNMPELETELAEFPLGQHDDLLDGLAYAVRLARPASREQVQTTNPFVVENILAELRQKAGQGPAPWSWPHRA